MTTRYFMKELPDSPLFIDGHPYKFDILQTQDPKLISELENCVRNHAGGVLEITAEEFNREAQKKTSGMSLGKQFSSPPMQRQELTAHHLNRPAAAGAVNLVAKPGPNTLPASGRDKPQPISVPSPNQFSGVFLKPQLAKASDVSEVTKS